MKRIFLIGTALLIAFSCRAGGLLTNTNQHISFLRMLARGTSMQIDGIYSNPAGVAWLGNGLYFSLNGQSVYQTRNISATFGLFPEGTRQYKGTASVPILPSAYIAFKHDQWAISGFFGVVGGGGKASFSTGLPMFDSRVMASIYAASNGAITPDQYSISSSMTGKQFIYGAQLGLSYSFNDHIAGFLGGRMDYFTGNYSGYVIATMKQGGYRTCRCGARLRPDRLGTDTHHRSRLSQWPVDCRTEVRTSYRTQYREYDEEELRSRRLAERL
jgi:long-chain fatty acid transport protein